LQAPADRCQLSPGETAVYDKRDGRLTVRRDDVSFASSWAQEQLFFRQRPLSEIVPSLSKWYHVKIALDPDIADTRFTFLLRKEPLEEILRLMKHIHPQINYQFDESNGLTLYSD
jgi:ferric-dicitrate binding protein FerR (iron transport regulator)